MIERDSIRVFLRLNLATVRAKVLLLNELSANRKAYVDHYIGPQDNRNLPIILTLLRLGDSDDR